MTARKWWADVAGCPESDMHEAHDGWGSRCGLCGYPRNGKPRKEAPRVVHTPGPKMVQIERDDAEFILRNLKDSAADCQSHGGEWTHQRSIIVLEKALGNLGEQA